MIGAARILTRRDGTYRPGPSGQWAAVTVIHNRYGELCDLVAWLPGEPEAWWLRRGDETPFLGTRNLAMAAYYGDTITLHPTPQDWLLAGRKGVCVLKWSWPLDDLFADGANTTIWFYGHKHLAQPIDCNAAIAIHLVNFL